MLVSEVCIIRLVNNLSKEQGLFGGLYWMEYFMCMSRSVILGGCM